MLGGECSACSSPTFTPPPSDDEVEVPVPGHPLPRREDPLPVAPPAVVSPGLLGLLQTPRSASIVVCLYTF